MEVRGGCGYIEEFPDARLVRDSHLGSIWEGTSNIVALDVMRAVEREDALPVLAAHVCGLLGYGTERHSDDASAEAWGRAEGLTRVALGNPSLARQAASALYHATSAAALGWEGVRLACPGRAALAELVQRHRLAPRDPLAATDDTALQDAVLAVAA